MLLDRARDCRFVLYGAPYEHTSSYRAGSKDGPDAMIRASHYVELYDEELNQETYRHGGICTRGRDRHRSRPSASSSAESVDGRDV